MSSDPTAPRRPAATIAPPWATLAGTGGGGEPRGFVPLPGELRAAFLDRAGAGPMGGLFETAREGQGGEFSLAVGAPVLALVTRGSTCFRYAGGAWRHDEGDPLAAIQRLFEEARSLARGGHFPGLVAGALGYDLGRALERLPRLAREDQPLPDIVLGAYARALVYDHRSGRARELVDDGLARLPALASWPRELEALTPPPAALPPRTFSRAAYLEAVGAVRAAIARGDVYQVNLSQRFAAPWTRGPAALYERLRAASPAPCAALLHFGPHALVSSSPEEFLRVDGARVATRPIKGTRPRGADPASDDALARELDASDKDRAELTMIVDLMRNDLGRIAEPGSVRVTVPRVLEAHPTVWQAVATIEAQLGPGASLVDLWRATFPGGSITGAPKVAAMTLIERLEPVRRGFFTGSLLVAGLDGTLRSSIAIRTMQLSGSLATFHAGGGVVWDSDPASEYDETLVKGRAMAQALGLEWESSERG